MNKPLMRSISVGNLNYHHISRPMSAKSDGIMYRHYHQNKPPHIPQFIEPTSFDIGSDWNAWHSIISRYLSNSFEYNRHKCQWRGNVYDAREIEETYIIINVFSTSHCSMKIEVQRRSGDTILFHNFYQKFKQFILFGKEYPIVTYDTLKHAFVYKDTKDTIDIFVNMINSNYIEPSTEGLKGLLHMLHNKHTMEVFQKEYRQWTPISFPENKTHTRLSNLLLSRTKTK